MRSEQTFVIVGASLAGATAAEALREEGFDGRVVLVGAERERPYERPPLSKDYLRGESEREKIFVHAASFYAEREIELRTETAAHAIDVDAREVVLAGGERLGYERLLLATGAEPRRLEIPGQSRRRALPAHVRGFRRAACPPGRRRAGRRYRGGMDRRRGCGVGAPARPRCDGDRAGVGAAGARARPGSRGDLSRHPSRPRCRADARHRRRGLRGRRRGQARAYKRRPRDRLRLRGRRGRRQASHRARRGGGAQGRQRDPRRREPEDERRGRVCGRRRRQRPTPLL